MIQHNKIGKVKDRVFLLIGLEEFSPTYSIKMMCYFSCEKYMFFK
jgi:hypothetical protein